MENYLSVETKKEHKLITSLLSGKIIEKITKVNCDEGLTIHFTDETKLEFGYSGGYGEVAINNKKIDCKGI